MSIENEIRTETSPDRVARLHRLLDLLETYLDSGFFLSMIGKIVVDEKKIYSVLSELRSLQFDFEADRKAAAAREEERKAAVESAKATVPVLSEPDMAAGTEQDRNYALSVRRGADVYAAGVLDNLEQTLQKMMVTLQEGKKLLQQRLNQEVKRDGATEI